jgi:hypothetical protein
MTSWVILRTEILPDSQKISIFTNPDVHNCAHSNQSLDTDKLIVILKSYV